MSTNELIHRNEYVPALSGLRFLAAFAVIFAHYGYWVSPFTPDAGRGFQIGTSNFGMTLFFVLSGFVIHLTYSNWFATLPSTKAVLLFAFARFARLYPLYLFFLGFCLIRTHTALLRFAYDAEFREFVWIHVLGIQTWYPFMLDGKLPIHSVFNVSWSISTEMFFYLAYPAIYFLLKKLRTPGQTVIALCAFSAMVFILLFVGLASISGFCRFLEAWLSLKPENDGSSAFIWLTYISPYFRIPEFVVGALFAHLYLQVRQGRGNAVSALPFKSLATAGFLSVLLLGLLAAQFPHSSYLALLHRNFLLAPSVGLMMFGMAVYQGRMALFFSTSAFVWLGEISYSLYLLHPFMPRLIDITYNTYQLSVNSVALFFANFGVTFLMLAALSYGTFKIIEVPMRKAIRSVGQRLVFGRTRADLAL